MNKSGKKTEEKTYNIREFTVECETRQTQSGTREWATLYKDGVEVAEASYFWSNRPWRRFPSSPAIKQCLKATGEFSDDEIEQCIEDISNDRMNADNTFGILRAVCAMGEIMNDNQKDRNDWKKRMLKAGLPGLQIPDDWDELSEDEKERRLNGVVELTTKEVKE